MKKASLKLFVTLTLAWSCNAFAVTTNDRCLAHLDDRQSGSTLNLNGCPLNVPSGALTIQAYLTKHPEVNTVNLSGSDLDNESAKIIGQTPTIKNFYLANNLIDDDGVLGLTQNEHLESLILDGNPIGNVGMAALGALPNLTYLSIGNYGTLDPETLPAISKSHSIEELSLNYQQVDRKSISALNNMPSLRELSLVNTKPGDEVAIALKDNSSVQSLSLYDTEVSDSEIKLFMMMPKLEAFYVMDGYDGKPSRVTDEGVVAVAKNTRLVFAEFGGNVIGKKGLEALSQNNTLSELALSQNQLGDAGAVTLAQSGFSFKALSLDDNQIGDVGAMALAATLAQHSNLEQLSLEFNQIGDTGAMAFLKSKQLKKLDLRWNDIGQRGVNALKKAAGNSGPAKVKLKGNPGFTD